MEQFMICLRNANFFARRGCRKKHKALAFQHEKDKESVTAPPEARVSQQRHQLGEELVLAFLAEEEFANDVMPLAFRHAD